VAAGAVVVAVVPAVEDTVGLGEDPHPNTLMARTRIKKRDAHFTVFFIYHSPPFHLNWNYSGFILFDNKKPDNWMN
jgi:hypothetical protein